MTRVHTSQIIDAITSIKATPMLVKVTSPQELGLIVRAVRKQQKLRMDDVAGSAGVGPVFVRDVERGKPTVQLGRVMKLLAELGVTLNVDIPPAAGAMLETVKKTGVKPLRPRRPKSPGDPVVPKSHDESGGEPTP